MNGLLKGELNEVWGKGKWQNLFAPVDIAAVVLFRIAFGFIMFWEVTRYFRHGWIYRYWVEPLWNFSYGPFHFRPMGEDAMHILWLVLGILAIFISIGFLYRISTILFFCGFTYTYLLEQGRYLNHFYLVVLISFVLIFIPANKYYSLDAKIWKKIKSPVIESWCLWLVRFMIGVPYFFGGIAKINPDWLQGYPLRIWLLSDTDFPIIGPYFTEYWMILIMSYSGLLLDLFIVPALLWKKTRKYGFVVITLFHLMNDQLFTIGIFPWFMMCATSLFFSPSWPRNFINFFRKNRLTIEKQDIKNFQEYASQINPKPILIGLAIFCGLQVTLPFRHHLIPGNVNWTEEGHRYAWHMKLRSKRGYTDFFVKNKANGETIEVDLEGYLQDWQIDDMEGKPYMIWEFADYLKDQYAEAGIDVEVYVDAVASLNGRKYQHIIDPNVDLAAQPKPYFGYASWIMPLTTPLSEQR